MRVAPVGAYTVSEVFNTNRFGEVVLAAGDEVARIPNDLHRPGTPEAQAVATDNALRRILVDDGKTTNLSTAGLLPPYVYPDAPLRVGDSVDAFGASVLSYGFDEWRLQPIAPIDATTTPPARTSFKVTNPRTPAPAAVGGDLKVAAFNVLNYFVHFGGEARGAANPAELAEQEAKIVSAIGALDADVIALQEIENSVRFEPTDPQQALVRLVAALNTAEGAGTYDYVRSPANLPAAEQQDFITTAIIFKPAAAQPVGASRTINDETVWFNAREPIAQTFTAGGATFTVVANHLKSKSGTGTGDNADTGRQGAFNGDRVRQAQSLAAFVEQLKTDSGSDDVLMLGDFNAYTLEDPMQVLYDAGYDDLNDTGKTSYVFGGEAGSLDHAVASASLAARVYRCGRLGDPTRVESFAFEYDGHPAFFEPDPYRASDHNPIVVGLDTAPAAGRPPAADHQRLPRSAGVARQRAGRPSDRRRGAARRARRPAPRGRTRTPLFVAAGDNIGASTFISAIDQDNPTIDALNLVGLDVSAVGNHEFDKGMADLTDRVIPRADFPYLGANVYRGDERALPGLRGADRRRRPGRLHRRRHRADRLAGQPGRHRRHHVPRPGAEAEAVAAELKDGNEANGEADVVVLLAHEGAAIREHRLRRGARGRPGVRRVRRGQRRHRRHLQRAHPPAVRLPGAGPRHRTSCGRCIQAQEYGKKLGKAVLT